MKIKDNQPLINVLGSRLQVENLKYEKASLFTDWLNCGFSTQQNYNLLQIAVCQMSHSNVHTDTFYLAV